MFKLLRYFSLTSAIAFVAATAILSVVHRQGQVDELVGFAERRNVALARSFANTIWPRFSAYVTSVSGLDGEALRARPETWEMHEAIRSLTAGLPVLKVKIYTLDGLTVYSSDFSQIGEDKSRNPALVAAAIRGKPTSKLIFRDEFNAFEGVVQDLSLVESYIPILGPDDAPEGVFELYSDVTVLLARIEDMTIDLVVGLVFAFGALYWVLFLVVRHADRVIKNQYRDLKTTEEAVRGKNRALESEIIARVVAQQALCESEENLRSIVENAGDAIFVHNFDGWIVEANPAACHMTGYSRDELMKLRVTDVAADGRNAHRVKDWTTIRPGHPVTYEDVHRRKDGSTFPVEVRLGVYKSGDKPLIVLIARDITQRRLAEERIKHLASHDVLTGLPNRVLFLDRLSTAMASARRNRTQVGVLFVDLDDFKAVNDTCGHDAGDLVLVEVARRLSACVRQSDTVGRHGGDEFVVALTSVSDRAGTVRVAEKIVAAMARPFAVNGAEVSCGASVGIALFPDHGETPEDLLKQADIAMYAVKRGGKNGCRLLSPDDRESMTEIADGFVI